MRWTRVGLASWQGNGLPRRRSVAAVSYTHLVLEVRASNDSAIRLYERNGFVQCGMRKGFYEFPKEDAYVMVHGH